MELLGGPGGPAGGEPEPSPDPQALHEGAQPPPATLLLTIHTRSPIVGRWLLQATLPTVPTTCPHPLLHPAPERGPCAFPATARKEGGECTGQGRCTCGPHQRLWGQRGRERPGKLGHAPHTGEPQGSGWAWGPQPAARTGPLSLHLRTRPAAPDVPARNGTGSATASTARSQGQSLSLPSKGLQSWWGGAAREGEMHTKYCERLGWRQEEDRGAPWEQRSRGSWKGGGDLTKKGQGA